jgi:hypothetical protein
MAGKTCSKSAKITERAAKPILIAGGNRQIVQAYIAAHAGLGKGRWAP